MANHSDIPEIVFDDSYLPIAIKTFIFFLVASFTVTPLISWYSCLTYRDISSYQKYDWNTRVLSCVHAVFASALGFYNLLFDQPTWEDPVWGTSYLTRATIAITTGYISSDLVIILYAFPLKDSVFYIVHHLAVVLAYLANMVYGPLTFFANARVIAEFSTPCVNFRWMLQLTGFKESKTYLYNGFAMLGSFFLVRVGIIPLYYYILFKTFFVEGGINRLPIWMTAVCFVASLALDSVNVYWFVKMARGAYKMLRKPSNSDPARTRIKGE
ncbi:TLC domain-containing protein 4-B-like [Diadema antillarum]|uniref:TLC domain-containing protein 4-B-like n=1 Tax=Diadema antillarum TaxID=105358 RepID=UPI003A871876